MFKGLKLRTRLFGGFGVIVALLAVVAVMSYFNLAGVVDRMEKSSGVTELVKLILQARQAEKNFMLRGDQTYVEDVEKLVQAIGRQADETKATFTDDYNRKQMDAVTARTGEYLAAFRHFVQMEAEKNKILADMDNKAAKALDESIAVRDDQEKQLDDIRQSNAATIAAKTHYAEEANNLVKEVLTAKAYRVQLMAQNDPETLALWKETNKKALGIANQLKNEFKEPENIQQAETVIREYTTYENAFLKFLDTQAEADRQTMLKAATATVAEINAIYKSQQTQLAAAEAEAEKQMNLKLAMAGEANQMARVFLDARRYEKEFIISRGQQAFMDQVDQNIARVMKTAESLMEQAATAENKNRIQAAINAVSSYNAEFDRFSGLLAEQKTADQTMIDTARAAQKECLAAKDDQQTKLASEIQSANLKMMIIALAGILFGLIMAYVITRGITVPIHRIIDNLSSGSAQVAAASGQVSQASQQLAEGSSEQAAGVEETSSSLEELTAMTRQNADNASQANALMDETRLIVNKAGDSMKQMNQAMQDISTSGAEIGKIIKTIDEIAFQTNLLALNAAVEAARAGEAGAGFAVVADEVRNLAQRAAEAAKNTAGLIEGTITKISLGTELVTASEKAFGDVETNSGKAAELVGEIAAASREQAQGIDQINEAVAQMDKVTQSNAANAEESASASEELSAQAESMQDVVAELITLVDGASETSGQASKQISQPKQQRLTAARPAGGQTMPARREARKPAGKSAAEDVIPLGDDFDSF